MRTFESFLIVASASLLFISASVPVRADDAPAIATPRYAALPNLTDQQRAKIAAIEKQADEQVMAILSDDQKVALRNQQAGGAAAPGGGLYAAEAASMQSGPIKSRDYWQSKFNADQLEKAIKDHQPEGAIALSLISEIQLEEDLLKQYPHHAEIIGWHDRALQVQKQIGDNFDRRAEFKPGCLWNNDSYMQSFVGYNTAKMAMDDKDYELAFLMSGLALQKVTYLTESDDHMADYPPDAREWIRKIKPELEKMHEVSGKATHHI